MIHTAAEAYQCRHLLQYLGEMAGDPLYTELLVGLGISSLSMAPVSIPLVRSGIGRISVKEAQTFVAQVLQMHTALEIKELITQRYTLRNEAVENGFNAAPNPISD